MKYNILFCLCLMFFECNPYEENNNIINRDIHDSEQNVNICISTLKKNKNIDNEIKKSFNETKKNNFMLTNINDNQRNILSNGSKTDVLKTIREINLNSSKFNQIMHKYFVNLFKYSKDGFNMYQQYLNDKNYTKREKLILTRLILKYDNDYEVILNNDKNINFDRIVCNKQFLEIFCQEYVNCMNIDDEYIPDIMRYCEQFDFRNMMLFSLKINYTSNIKNKFAEQIRKIDQGQNSSLTNEIKNKLKITPQTINNTFENLLIILKNKDKDIRLFLNEHKTINNESIRKFNEMFGN